MYGDKLVTNCSTFSLSLCISNHVLVLPKSYTFFKKLRLELFQFILKIIFLHLFFFPNTRFSKILEGSLGLYTMYRYHHAYGKLKLLYLGNKKNFLMYFSVIILWLCQKKYLKICMN